MQKRALVGSEKIRTVIVIAVISTESSAASTKQRKNYRSLYALGLSGDSMYSLVLQAYCFAAVVAAAAHADIV